MTDSQTHDVDTETLVVWINQAAAFEKRENYYEAVARIVTAKEAAEAALAGLTGEDGPAKATLEAIAGQCATLALRYRAQLEEWNAKIAAGRQARTDAAAEEMARPLPNPPPAK